MTNWNNQLLLCAWQGSTKWNGSQNMNQTVADSLFIIWIRYPWVFLALLLVGNPWETPTWRNFVLRNSVGCDCIIILYVAALPVFFSFSFFLFHLLHLLLIHLPNRVCFGETSTKSYRSHDYHNKNNNSQVIEGLQRSQYRVPITNNVKKL